MDPMTLQEPAIKEGVVAQWNERGFGFIHFSDGTRAYVHNSACGGEHLQEKESVFAVVVEDAKNPGKWAAQQVLRQGVMEQQVAAPVAGFMEPQLMDPQLGVVGGGLGVGLMQQQVALMQPQVSVPDGSGGTGLFERHEGVVSQWNERGYGFIQLNDGSRAYVHNSECGGEHLTVGEKVSATIEMDTMNPGKLCARAVKRGGDGEEGVVADWKEQGGYGFVNLDDGRRAYIHRSIIGAGDLIVGTRVKVELQPDSRNPGKFCVSSIALSNTPPPVKAPSNPGKGSAVPVVTSNGGDLGDLGDFDGIVSDWKDQGGFGFIDLDDGRRAYIHRTIVAASTGSSDLAVGTRIRVKLQPDQRNPGKWCVAGVLGPASEPGVQAAQMLEQAQFMEGVVADWKDSGYGFVNMDDGRRAYVHRTALGGTGSLTVGLRVQVLLKPDLRNPGKWCAETVLGDGVVMEPEAKRLRTE
mmetsp:Transcript_114875/g.199006  ORF Transcript_114875/g.199006 Transcript_114875/m.199006 type:complete len:467 (-) Transcript_114875:49-1449(-)